MVAVAYSKIPSQHLAGNTEQNNEKPTPQEHSSFLKSRFVPVARCPMQIGATYSLVLPYWPTSTRIMDFTKQVTVGTELNYPLPFLLSDSSSLLSNGCRGLFPRGQSSWGVNLGIHFRLLPKLRKRETIPPLPHPSSWRGA
jgi:hypothetical protein